VVLLPPELQGSGCLETLKGRNTMTPSATHSNAAATPAAGSPAAAASADLAESFAHFCLATGIEALTPMMNADGEAIAGERCGPTRDTPGYRWGPTRSKVALHGGPVDVRRPRVCSTATREEMALPTWEAVRSHDRLSQCTLNPMRLDVATRKSSRAVRMPGTGRPAANGSGLAKSAVSRRVTALGEARRAEWMGRDLSGRDLVAIQIEGLHLREDRLMIGAVGIDTDGRTHPLGVIEGATETAATVQALIDTLIERGLDPAGTGLFIVEGAKALGTVLRRTVGAAVPIPRCQIHTARTIIDRRPARDHTRVRPAFREAWAMEDADAAAATLRTRARRVEEGAPDAARSILEGRDAILTLTRLGLPPERRQSLARANIIESMHSVIRQTCRNVKRWQDARMALRWTAAGMPEAPKGFRRLKACRPLPILRETLVRHRRMSQLEQERKAA